MALFPQPVYLPISMSSYMCIYYFTIIYVCDCANSISYDLIMSWQNKQLCTYYNQSWCMYLHW